MHNSKAFDLHFILNRAIMLKCTTKLITKVLKIISLKMKYLVFLDSVSFFPFALRKLLVAFGLDATKSLYPHKFYTEENLDYVGPMNDISFYCVNEMSGGETMEFLEWYD